MVTGSSSTTNTNDSVAAFGDAGPPDVVLYIPSGRKQPAPKRKRAPRLEPITGHAVCTNRPDTMQAFGEVDPYNLLREDEELLLLV